MWSLAPAAAVPVMKEVALCFQLKLTYTELQSDESYFCDKPLTSQHRNWPDHTQVVIDFVPC